MESTESVNYKHVGENSASSSKECALKVSKVSEMDLEYSENPEKVGISENGLKEFTGCAITEPAISEAEFEKSEIPSLLSFSIGSYGNESSEFALLDSTMSEAGEVDPEKYERPEKVDSNLETPGSDPRTGTCAEFPEVFLNGQLSATPKKSSISSRRSSIFKQFDPLRTVVLHSSTSCTGRGSHLTGSNDFISGDSSSNDFTNLSENSLISYDLMCTAPLTPKVLFSGHAESPKKYPEKYLQKALKDQELRLTTQYMKRYVRSEFKFIEQSSDRKRELLNKVAMCKCYSELVSEMLGIRESLINRCKDLEDKIKLTKEDCASIESSKQICREDMSEYENTFSKIHKRYEEIKSTLEICKKNLRIYKENISIKKTLVDEQNNINCVLESRIRRIEEKAEKEIESAKKSSETQIAILEAQVKKAQMKICSLESTLEQAQSENKELVSIYDDLMSKYNS